MRNTKDSQFLLATSSRESLADSLEVLIEAVERYQSVLDGQINIASKQNK